MLEEESRKGVKTKMFGVCLIFLSALDSMLSWRGGIFISDFYLFLLVAGCFLYVIGAIRASEVQSGEIKSGETHSTPRR